IGNQQRHGHDHEDGLQHAFDEKSGHKSPPRLSPGKVGNVKASTGIVNAATGTVPAGCHGSGSAGP
ncbi:MAG: hypothetical protein OJK14_00585, partial [Achromobacter sp.]|uniref:hypothetical protein n=1 Tax=Achromobacter sp. TaxID=134375 RepID=UPI00258CFEF1